MNFRKHFVGENLYDTHYKVLSDRHVSALQSRLPAFNHVIIDPSSNAVITSRQAPNEKPHWPARDDLTQVTHAIGCGISLGFLLGKKF